MNDLKQFTGLYPLSKTLRFELKSLETFMKTNGLTHALVTTISETGKKEMPYGCLQFMPVACYAYTVGENTLKATKMTYGL